MDRSLMVGMLGRLEKEWLENVGMTQIVTIRGIGMVRKCWDS